MKAIVYYTINTILISKWKMVAILSIMVVEGISIISGASLIKITTPSPIPLYGAFFFLIFLNAGIIYSDFSIGKLELIFSKPVSKIGYFIGKFTAVFIVALIWDAINLLYLDLVTFIFQKKGIPLLYLGENFIFHLFNIVAVTIAIMFFSSFVATGIDSILFLITTAAAGILESNQIVPVWFTKYFIGFQFSTNSFRLFHEFESNWLQFFVGFFMTILVFGLAGFFILKKKIET